MIPDGFIGMNPATFLNMMGIYDFLNQCQHGIFYGQCPQCTQKEADDIRAGLIYRYANHKRA